MDNIVCGAVDDKAALALYRESKEALQAGGFNLCKFTAKSLTLQEHIDQLEKVPVISADSSDELTYAKSKVGELQGVPSSEQEVLGIR